MSNRKIISNVAGMDELAVQVAGEVRAGQVILLTGELGSGKTTFVQGLAKALGVKDQVTSPTFTVVGEYATGRGDIKTLVHVDLYRLAEGAGSDPAVVDVLERAGDGGRLTVIEWADRLRDNVKGDWMIEFRHGETKSERLVTI